MESLVEYGIYDPYDFLNKYSLKNIYLEQCYCEENEDVIKSKGATLRTRLERRK